jgi:hypothetical protein
LRRISFIGKPVCNNDPPPSSTKCFNRLLCQIYY